MGLTCLLRKWCCSLQWHLVSSPTLLCVPAFADLLVNDVLSLLSSRLQRVHSDTMGCPLSTLSTSCSFLCFRNQQKQRCKVRHALLFWTTVTFAGLAGLGFIQWGSCHLCSRVVCQGVGSSPVTAAWGTTVCTL